MQRSESDTNGTAEQSVAEQLQRLGVRSEVDAEMALGEIKGRVRQAADEAGILADYDAVSAEAERIWTSFGDERRGPRVATIDGTTGEVRDWRRPDTTPDRGPDVGTTIHAISDDRQMELLFAVPAAAKFGTAPYLAAPELEQIALRLIETKEAFDELLDLKIVYRWKAKGGTSKGHPKLGGIERVSGQTLAFIAGPAPDLLVWLAADTLRDSGVTELQVEAVLFDQLASIEWSDGDEDEDGDPTWRLVGPEIMCHLATLEEYGPFTRKLQAARPAFSQPGLFDGPLDPVAGDDGSGVLIHADGTPMTADEIAEMEAAEERGEQDDPGDEDDASGFGASDEGQDVEARLAERCPHGHAGCDGRHDLSDDPVS